MANKKMDPTLMKAGEEAFWKQFDEADRPEERYYVVDKKTGDILVHNARLTKEKRKIEV
jgi:hypothetical protein